MKVGDLVVMIDETVLEGELMSIGIIMDDDIRFPGGKRESVCCGTTATVLISNQEIGWR